MTENNLVIELNKLLKKLVAAGNNVQDAENYCQRIFNLVFNN